MFVSVFSTDHGETSMDLTSDIVRRAVARVARRIIETALVDRFASRRCESGDDGLASVPREIGGDSPPNLALSGLHDV